MSFVCNFCHGEYGYFEMHPIKLRPEDESKVLVCEKCLGWKESDKVKKLRKTLDKT